MEKAIGIVRNPEGLTEIISRRACELDGARGSFAWARQIEQEVGLYELVERSLDARASTPRSREERVYAAWNVLRCVRTLGVETLFQILVILLETVPGEPVPGVASDVYPEPEEYAAVVKPTAAHPRAYRGTKHKPPKAKKPPVVDLRPGLCDGTSPSRHLTVLDKHRITALEKLQRYGYDIRAFASRGAEDDLLTAFEQPVFQTLQDVRFPVSFRLSLWFLSQRLAWPDASAYVGVYWTLGLERHLPLLEAVVRLVSLQPDQNTLAWCGIVAQQPEEVRLTFTRMLIETEAYRLDVMGMPLPTTLAAFESLLHGPDYAYRLGCVLHGLATGVAPDYLLAGFELADRCSRGYGFDKIQRSGVFPAEAVDGLTEYVHSAAGYYEIFPLMLWERCGELPGLDRIISTVDWRRYSPDVAIQFVDCWMDFAWHELSTDEREAKWTFVQQETTNIFALINSVPAEYQCKCIDYLKDFYWFWDDPAELEIDMPFAYMILRRLAHPPFRPSSRAARIIADFLECRNGSWREDFLNAPDSSYLRLEEACRLRSNTRLTERGIQPLVTHLPEFSVTCFLHFPAKLFKIAKLLGCLPKPMQDQVVREFSALSLMRVSLAGLSLNEIGALIADYCSPPVTNPLPRRLQEHLRGLRSLSEPQVRRDCAQMERHLDLTRLEVLEARIWREFQGDLQVDLANAALRHALQMRYDVDENRRALRKFLKAYEMGSQDYILAHPATRAWLRQHSQVNLETWLRGVDYNGGSDAPDALRLEVEQDPLEVLKMGTYVGSCLGLGGDFAYSAVAVMLDVNKRVIYARDQNGAVVARQLVAISEAEELVCFGVYPYTIGAGIKQRFLEYDTLFAQALGLKLHAVDRDSKYVVKNILSQGWYDDSAWDHRLE